MNFFFTCVNKNVSFIDLFFCLYSSKFYRKVHMLPTISDVEQYLKLDDTYIPKPVVEWVMWYCVVMVMISLYLCSHDKSLLSRQQSYAVAPPPPRQDNGDDKAKGDHDSDKPRGDDNKLQDITAAN